MENKKTTITINIKRENLFTAYDMAGLAFKFFSGKFDADSVGFSSENSTVVLSLDFGNYRVLSLLASLAELYKDLDFYAEEQAEVEELKIA